MNIWIQLWQCSLDATHAQNSPYFHTFIFMATYLNAIALLFAQGFSKFPLVLQNVKL